MKTTTTMTAADGSQYDIPSDEMDAFKTDFPDARQSNSYRVGGDEYVIPQDEDEAFRKDFADAEKTRTIQFANGKTRQFTANELSRFLRSKEFREGDEFKGDRGEADQGSTAWAATKGAISGAAEGALAGGTNAANKIVKALPGLAADMSIAAGNLINGGGNAPSAAGNFFKDLGQEFKDRMDALLPSGNLADRLGYEDWSTKSSEKVADVAAMAYRFAPAMFGGPAALEAILATDAVNAFSDSFEKSVATDGDVVKANVLGASSALINYFCGKMLMGGGKAAQGLGREMSGGLASKVAEFVLGGAKTAGVMGVQSAANKAVENMATGKPGAEGVLKAGLEGAGEGALFHGMNAVPSLALGLKDARKARAMRDEATLTVLGQEGGAEFWAGLNPDGADKLARAYREDGHVSRRVAKDAELPEMPQADRDALARKIAELNDARARRNRVRPDEQQSNALTQEIMKGGADMEQQGRIYEDVLSHIRDAKELDDPARREELVRAAERRILEEQRSERAEREQAEDDAATAAEESRWAEANSRAEAQKADDEATAAEEARWADANLKAEEAETAPSAKPEEAGASNVASDPAKAPAPVLKRLNIDDFSNWPENLLSERLARLKRVRANITEKNKNRVVSKDDVNREISAIEAELAKRGGPEPVASPEAADAPTAKEGGNPAKTETVPDGKGKMVEVPAYGDDYKAWLKGRPKGQRRDTKKARAEWDELQKAKAEKPSDDDSPVGSQGGSGTESATPTNPAEAEAAMVPDGKGKMKPASSSPLDEFIKVSDGKGGKTSPSEAAANGDDVSIQDLAKHIRSTWGSEGGKYDGDVKALVAKVLARGDRKLTEILGDIPERIERGAKSLKESPVLVSPRDSMVENGFTPEQKYEAEMRRWENAEAAAKKYGVENTYPRPQKPAPKAGAPSAPQADQYADARKVLKEKFFQDEASLKRQMNALPPQAKRLREAYEAAIRFAQEKSSLSAQADGERTGRYRAEIDVKTQAQKLDLNDPANIPYMRWLRKNARVNTPGARRDFDRQQAKAAEAVVRNFVPDGKVVYHEGGVEVPDGARMMAVGGSLPPAAAAANGEPTSARGVSGGTTSRTIAPEGARPVEAFAASIANGGAKSPADFLNGLNESLGNKTTNPDKSQYYDVTRPDGAALSVSSLRVSNHRGTASQAQTHGNTADTKIGIVVKMSEKPFRSSPAVKYTEYVYFPDKLDAVRQADIAKAVAEWVRTGRFNAPSADQVNVSGNVKPGSRLLYSKDGSVVGWFDKSTRTTHLLPGADAATVAHEIGWHASYDHAERLAAKGDRALLDKLNAFADNAPQQVKNDIAARYGNVGVVDPAVIREEVGAARYTMDNVRKIADEVQRRQAAKWYRKAWDSCVDAYKSMLTKAGYNKVNLDAMNAMTPEAAVDFMAKEMARGKSLGKVEDRSKIDMGGKAVGVKQTLAAARDAYMRKMKDYRQPLKGLDEDLRKAGMDIGLFREARLQPGRQQKWADHVESKTKEFFDLCKKDGVDYAEVNEYMWAQAAAERNAKTRSQTGAAMTDAEAADILARYQASPKAAALAKISDLLLDLQREGLEFRRDSGLLSDDLFNKWTAEEPHHVPMKSPIVDGEYVGRDGGGRVGRPEFKTARGRTNLGDDPVGWIFAEALDAHLRGEENMLRRRLLPALIAHLEIGRFSAAADGSPRELRSRGGEGAANVLEFKHDGQSWIMELNGARGEAIQAAMNGRNLVSAPKWMQTANRLWASTATQLSLTFSGRNAVADNIDVIGINYAENGFIGGTAANARHFRNMVRAYPKAFEFARTGKTSDPSLQAYVDAGGLIGGVGNEGYTSIAEGIRKDFASGKRNPVALVKAVFRGIKVLNETVELATRVGDFENQVAMGKSAKDAALHSREVSVDFNQKGEWTGVTNVYRMFSNSTLGAACRQIAAITASPKAAATVVSGMFGVGLAEGLLECVANGDESDAEKAGKSTGADVTEYTRANSVYFRSGEKVYRLPFHAGPFSVLKYAGNCAARKLMGAFDRKNTTATKAQTELANEALGVLMQFTGLGDAGPDVLQTVAPTLLQPVIQMLTNTDYAGRPIERTAFNKNDPKAYNGRESTPARYKWLAEGLNDASGGNRGRRGALDVSPEYLKYGLEQAGKNAMRDIENVVSVVGMMAGVEKADPRNMPGVRDYYRPQDGNDARYFRAIDRYQADENDWKRNLASRTPEERRAYMAEHPWLRRAGGAKTRVAELEGRIKDLRQLEKGLAKNASGAWVERRTKPTDEQVEAWRAKRRALQAKVISLVGGE